MDIGGGGKKKKRKKKWIFLVITKCNEKLVGSARDHKGRGD